MKVRVVVNSPLITTRMTNVLHALVYYYKSGVFFRLSIIIRLVYSFDCEVAPTCTTLCLIHKIPLLGKSTPIEYTSGTRRELGTVHDVYRAGCNNIDSRCFSIERWQLAAVSATSVRH